MRSSDRCIAESLYARLLVLYPAAFRARFGAEMLDLFRETYSDEAQHAPLKERLTFWLRTLLDTVKSLPAEWAHVARHTEILETFRKDVTDLLAVPVWIIAILLMQGYTWAVLAQFLENLFHHVNVPAGGYDTPGLLAVAAIATASLALVSGLAAWVIGRSNRIPDSILRL